MKHVYFGNQKRGQLHSISFPSEPGLCAAPHAASGRRPPRRRRGHRRGLERGRGLDAAGAGAREGGLAAAEAEAAAARCAKISPLCGTSPLQKGEDSMIQSGVEWNESVS